MALPVNPQNYSVNRVGKEAIRSSLYDFQTYASLGQSQLQFFQVQAGQGGKTKADTNMEAAGSLPSPKQFLIETIEVYFYSGAALDSSGAVASSTQSADLLAFAKSGYLDLFIGSKSYLTEAPIGRFPPSTGLKVDTTIGATLTAPNAIKSDYATMTGLIYRVQPEILLEPTQNFNVTLNWPTILPLPSGAAGRVGVVMRGLLYRNSQ